MKELDDVSNPDRPYPYEMVLRINQDRLNKFLPSEEVQSLNI